MALQLDVRQAQLSFKDTQTRLATTARAADQAEESLHLTKERYANGLALLTQLLDAETARTAAHQRRAAAEADYCIAHAALERAVGQPWKE